MSVNDRITSYIPYARLWHGDEGEVWRALPAGNPDGDRNLILKIGHNEAGHAIIRAEAEAMGMMAGGVDEDGAADVLRLMDAAVGHDPPYVVYPDPGYGSLAGHVSKRQTLDESATANLLRDMLAALGYAGSRGVVHGALTPASVIIDPGFNASVVDFRPGVSPPTSPGKDDSPPMLYAGDAASFIEWRHFIAPEAREDGPGNRSDQYSAGAIAAWALLGDSFGRNWEQALLRMGVSQTMRRILVRLCDEQPAERYPDAAAAMRVVETVFLQRSTNIRLGRLTSGSEDEVPTMEAPISKIKPLVMVLLIPLALVALAIAGVMFFGDDDGPSRPSPFRPDAGPPDNSRTPPTIRVGNES